MIDFQKIGIVGRSKMGKSTYMDRAIRAHKRLIVFDTVDERAETATNERLIEVRSMDELQNLIHKNYHRGFRYWFHPERRSDKIKALAELSDCLLETQSNFADDRRLRINQKLADGIPLTPSEKLPINEVRPSLMLAVDELATCVPNHSMKKESDDFELLCREGRHKGIHLVGAAQRLAEVSTKFRGQIEKWVFFNLKIAVDLDAVAKMGGLKDGARLADAVGSLLPLEFIRMENREYTKGKITFP